VPKTAIVNNSPILGEIIRDSSGDVNAEASLPMVRLPRSGKILHCLLTFIFPVTPLIPSTPEEIMELLSVAQKYQMEPALTHIRGSISRRNSLPTRRLEPALHIYALAQKYGLRPEALQAARAILKYPMTIEDLDNRLDIMSGASLYELWKYHERVLGILASDLTEFRVSGARGTMTGLRCEKYGPQDIPLWLDQYIESIGKAPDLFEFNTAMARHRNRQSETGTGNDVQGLDSGLEHWNGDEALCQCAIIPSQTLRDFWEALASVVRGSFEKVSLADRSSCLVC
jgi:hypothetical protein